MLFAKGGMAGAVAALVMMSAVANAGTFPDYGYQPPASYKGPLFHLSQDYPKALPQGPLPAFFDLLPAKHSNNFEQWRPYMEAVKKYCLEGNVENDWDVQKNPIRHWYHAPWQHYGPLGREGIHGLTKEAQIQKQQLAPTQSATGQTFAVGIYNDIGGYTFGEVWKDPQNPDPSYTSQPNSFHNGTVVCKALFADIDVSQVPFLVQPVLWKAYVTDSFASANREIKEVALIQMDFAVRDTRMPGTGWIFGTFQYNGNMTHKPSWDNLVPVGVMWGNDPENTGNDHTNPKPSITKINPTILESAINPNTSELPPTHLGWNGRLNGPVDNPVSSCLSCHMTAESPQLAPMNPTFQAPDKVPPVGSKEWMRWFQNIDAGVPFSPGALSTDFSLQLAGGIANFYDWKCNQGGVFADGHNACEQARNFRLKLMKSATPPAKVYKVERDPALNELH
ncbi:hypothetical protein DWU98_10685 [Dyella monticola]|uniref:Cytochrome c domain-containing protein n=1 Tax=Dyella monticola TaxID=1927958 RepID=A0A370X069_9GAMM|nr:hypothetical protein [Dyella monticola]RDS81680.1 hypothetical protein DWU98_10685 [Dyella monticola]